MGEAAPAKRPFYRLLYVQVLFAILLGLLFGWLFPDVAQSDWVKALGDGFVKLIKMVIGPIIFCTVASGIAHIDDARKVGRVGVKALVYFEVVSTLALALGLLIGNVVQPGAGFSGTGDAAAVADYTARASHESVVAFILDIIPDSAVGAFARGDILQVLLFAVLFGFALMALGDRGRTVRSLVDDLGHAFFGVIAVIMKAAPIGAFGAMAFTIGKYGVGTLLSLAQLMIAFYVTCLIFVLFVLGGIAWLVGFNILKFIKYIKEELLIVLGTSSSESVLPRMIAKLENLGCKESVVGLVIPTGYSFNLDGTCIYLTMAAIFLAQATNTELTLWQQLGIIGVLLLTSKGAAGVTGSGFIVLAATLASVGTIPVASIALILGVDRFMSEARALTNLVGNGVATVVVAKWEDALDEDRMRRTLDHETDREASDPEVAMGPPEPLLPQPST